MANDLSPVQRQMLALALSSAGPPLIHGAAPILGPEMRGGLPPAVTRAIAPNLGIYIGKKGDFVTGVNPPGTNEQPDPTMPSIRLPRGDQRFEFQDQPWDNDLLFRNT